MLLIALTNFNEGAEFMMILACTIQFYEHFESDPQYVSLHMALISLPYGLACIFGLLSDTTDVLGLKKRFYILIASLLQIAMSALLVTQSFLGGEKSQLLFTLYVALIVMAHTLI